MIQRLAWVQMGMRRRRKIGWRGRTSSHEPKIKTLKWQCEHQHHLVNVNRGSSCQRLRPRLDTKKQLIEPTAPPLKEKRVSRPPAPALTSRSTSLAPTPAHSIPQLHSHKPPAATQIVIATSSQRVRPRRPPISPDVRIPLDFRSTPRSEMHSFVNI